MQAFARLWAGPAGRASFLVLAALVLTGCGVNQIPTLDERAKAAWSEVLNQYQRRADLIPNLVETVKGFAEQESRVLTEVVEARAKAKQVQIPPDILTNKEAFDSFQDAQNNLSGALGRLLVVVERYPDLKSNQNFLALQSQLEGTENRIAIARRASITASSMGLPLARPPYRFVTNAMSAGSDMLPCIAMTAGTPASSIVAATPGISSPASAEKQEFTTTSRKPPLNATVICSRIQLSSARSAIPAPCDPSSPPSPTRTSSSAAPPPSASSA